MLTHKTLAAIRANMRDCILSGGEVRIPSSDVQALLEEIERLHREMEAQRPIVEAAQHWLEVWEEESPNSMRRERETHRRNLNRR